MTAHIRIQTGIIDTTFDGTTYDNDEVFNNRVCRSACALPAVA